MTCIICGEEIPEDTIWEHPPDICPACYREEIESLFGYDAYH